MPKTVSVLPAATLPPSGTNETPLSRKLTLASLATMPAESEEARKVMAYSLANVNELLATPADAPLSPLLIVEEGEDILVAKWPGSRTNSQVTPVLLWNDSQSDTIVFKCPASQINSPALLVRLLTSMLSWKHPELGSTNLWMTHPKGPDMEFRGWAERARGSQFPLEPVAFSGFVGGGTAYLAIRARDSRFGEIEERFPPLSTRVPYWEAARLFSEIGCSRHAKERFFGPYQRDQVLVLELMKRDALNLADFRDLLFRRVGNRPSMGDALPEMVRMAIDFHRVGRFAPAILEYFDHGIAALGSDTIFLALVSEPEVDLESRAIDCLSKRRAVLGALQYLQARSASERAYDAVLTFQGVDWEETLKKRTAEAIAKRLRSEK